MENNNKLKWQGPFKNERFPSDHFETDTPLGKIFICNTNNTHLTIEELIKEDTGFNYRQVYFSVVFEKFPENNTTQNSNIKYGFDIAENWLASKYSELSQIFDTNPMLSAAQRIHQVLVNKYCDIAKEHEGKTPKEIPDCVKVREALNVLEEIFPETKFKG